MADVIFVAVMIAFFGLAVLFVKGCERIIGRDTVAETVEVSDAAVRAKARSVTGTESVIGLGLSLLATAYLVYALLFPEKL